MGKKKAPQDATLRNVRAARGRTDRIGARLTRLEHAVALLAASVAALATVIGKGRR